MILDQWWFWLMIVIMSPFIFVLLFFIITYLMTLIAEIIDGLVSIFKRREKK